MGVLGYERISEDYYPTPAWCTETLLKHFKPQNVVWEPACGTGHISKVLSKHGYDVYSTDLVYRGYGQPGENDFLKKGVPALTDGRIIQSIITNPPYAGDLPEQFIRRALDMMEGVNGSVAMLLRNEYDCASSRVGLFRDPSFAMKIVLTKRPKWIEGSTGSPRHNYSWFIWRFDTAGKPPTIVWDQA